MPPNESVARGRRILQAYVWGMAAIVVVRQQKKAPPLRTGPWVGGLNFQLERADAHLLRQPSFVISVGVLNLRALRSRALVPRAGDGEILDGPTEPNLNTGLIAALEATPKSPALRVVGD